MGPWDQQPGLFTFLFLSIFPNAITPGETPRVPGNGFAIALHESTGCAQERELSPET